MELWPAPASPFACRPVEASGVQVHATVVAIDGVGVMLRGPSGGGKSDLALRLIDGGALLVADDRCDLRLEGGEVIVEAPPSLAGLLEVRAMGVVPAPSIPRVALALVIDLTPPDRIERLPRAAACAYLGIEFPLVSLAAFEASSAAKVRLAARHTARGILIVK
jgi:HPr kinase/phosphorylase